jgi:hypothetical protein
MASGVGGCSTKHVGSNYTQQAVYNRMSFVLFRLLCNSLLVQPTYEELYTLVPV